jgi:hypothetical protein
MCRCLSSVIVLSDGTTSARCSHSASSLFGEFIDPLVAGVALLVSELLAQLQELGAEPPDSKSYCASASHCNDQGMV